MEDPTATPLFGRSMVSEMLRWVWGCDEAYAAVLAI